MERIQKWLRNWKHRRKDNYRSQIFKIDRTDRNQSTAGVLTLDILYQKNKEGSVDVGRGSCWVQKLNDLSSGFFSLSHDLLLSLSLSLFIPLKQKAKLCFELKGGENGSLQESRELLNNFIRNGRASWPMLAVIDDRTFINAYTFINVQK